MTKPDVADHATTTGMTGGGFYNANSSPQWRSIEAVIPWLVDAMSEVSLEGDQPITLADFGCSEGANSIAVMSKAVETLLARSEKDIHTIHSDLPTNDFSALFPKLRPRGASVFGSDKVFSSVVGGSMFDQLLPRNSLSLATCFNAIGFLSKRPTKTLPGYILPNGPSKIRANGFISDDDLSAFSDLAKTDVATFLKARAAELRPGGKVLLQVFGCKGDIRTCDGIYDLLNDAVLSFVRSGRIPEALYETYYQPVYMRSLDELTAPIEDPSYGLDTVYELNLARDYEIEVPFNIDFAALGDLDAYAKHYVDFFRAFSEMVLQNALSELPESEDLVEEIYQRAVSLLKENPQTYPFRYAAIAMLLTKKA